MLKRKQQISPFSTQVSFVINTVKGEHFGKQNLLVSVNNHLFILVPRTIQKRFHFYDSGFNLYIEPKQMINLSISVISPINGKGFMHAILSYQLPPPTQSRMQNIELHSFGDTYIISLSLFLSSCYIYPPISRSIDYHSKVEKSQNFNGKSNLKAFGKNNDVSDSSSFTRRYSLSYSVSESSSLESENGHQKIPPLVNSLNSESSTVDTTTLMSSSS